MEEKQIAEETETTETPETVEEPEMISMEEFKKYRSDSEKGVQKVIAEKKMYEKVIDNVAKVSQDPSYLLEVYDEDPKAAQIILDKYYDGISIDDFEAKLVSEADDANLDPKMIKRKIEREIEQKMLKKELAKDYDDFIAKAGLEGDDLDKFKGFYNDLVEGKKLDSDTQHKRLTLAYKEVTGGKPSKVIKEVAKAMSGGTSNQKPSASDTMDPRQKEVMEYTKKMREAGMI